MKDKNTYFNRKGQENFIDIFLKMTLKKEQTLKDIGMSIYKYIILLMV